MQATLIIIVSIYQNLFLLFSTIIYRLFYSIFHPASNIFQKSANLSFQTCLHYIYISFRSIFLPNPTFFRAFLKTFYSIGSVPPRPEPPRLTIRSNTCRNRANIRNQAKKSGYLTITRFLRTK